MNWDRHDSGPRAGEIDLSGVTRVRLGRGTVKAVLAGVGALVLVLLAVGSMAPSPPPSSPVAASTPSPTTSAAPSPAYAPLSPTPTEWAAVTGERVRVARVIDGDTLVLDDGDRVRVLGIDSCEAGTPGGQRATERAESLLRGAAVTLTREPGVDRDRYDRALRYVQVDGADFGEAMVSSDHTGVYSGRNDASPEYLARLRELDYGRDCADRPTPNHVPHVDIDSDDDGESRFCRKRFWC